MSIFIDTCVFPVGEPSLFYDYFSKFKNDICFEIHSKFDEDKFEQDLNYVLADCPKTRYAFHEPVFFADHTAKCGTETYNKTIKMLEQTNYYAKKFNAEHLVYHINNCKFNPKDKTKLLKISLENLDKIKKMFNYLDVYIENVGTITQENMLLDQKEFTLLCKENNFSVLIDIGHAHANSWDLYKLVTDLKCNIKAFHIHNNDGQNDLHNRIFDGTFNNVEFLKFAYELVPNAKWIIEYVDSKYKDKALKEDVLSLLKIQQSIIKM